MKEVVFLSLIVAIVATGLGEGDVDIINNTTTHSNSTSEAPTSAKAATTSLPSPTSGVTAVSTQHETTSSASPTTTAKPLDVYAVEENGFYCIIIDASISIAVNYFNHTANKSESCTVVVPPPRNVTVTGNCTGERPNEQYITIQFNGDWSLTMRFERLSGGKYFQSNLTLDWNLTTSCANRTGGGQIENNTHLFETTTGYLCTARKVLYSNTTAVNGIGSIYTEKLRLEAFKNQTNTAFSDKSERCSEDSISNLVPIIVGACLGGLIIIVLIAYLIGRKRSRRGYESV